jgi:photosystem II stability/assembly factor-like uncharacterized protein
LAAGFAASDTNASAKPVRPWFVWLHMTSAKDGYALSGPDYRRQLLLRTSDGGHVWHVITVGGKTIHPNAPPDIRGRTILFSRSVGHHAFVVEHSDDGGRTWTKSAPFSGAGTPRPVDRRHLYLGVEEGAAAGSEGEALYTSSDGGRHWRLVTQTNVNRTPPSGLPFGCDKDGFGFATPSRGWAGGYCAGGPAFFLRTDDGGRHWNRQTLPDAPKNCACDTPAPTFFSRLVGVVSVSGIANNGGGKPFSRIYWTADGGRHWRGSEPTRGRRTGSIDAVSPKVVWLFGRLSGVVPKLPRVFRTANAGRSWKSVRLPIAIGDDNVDAVNARLGFVTSKAVIWRTTDGGHAWTTIHAVVASR